MTPPTLPQRHSWMGSVSHLHLYVLLLSHLGLKQTEIAERLNIQYTTVSQVVNSEVGQLVLKDLGNSAVERTLDLSEEFTQMLQENLDLPRQMLSGRIKHPVRTKRKAIDDKGQVIEEEVIEEQELTVSPGDRMNTFKEIGRLAGLGRPTTVVNNNVFTFERLQRIKERARDLGVLAVEDEIE